jgi:RNA polymerase sigma-70 factor (ECF subfamily)
MIPLDRQISDECLDDITTRMTLLIKAKVPGDAATAALSALLLRYTGAVYRYILGAVHDQHAADDLTQKFAVRFLSGAFRGADPQRGRFRDYLRTALINLVNDYFNEIRRQPGPLIVDVAAPAAGPASSASDFLADWRTEMLERTWKALKKVNALYHAVLRYRTENPDVQAAPMAEHLSAALGRPLTAASARKALQRAREKYADLLIEEVAVSLEQPSPEMLERELQELNLMPYCRQALRRRQERG